MISSPQRRTDADASGSPRIDVDPRLKRSRLGHEAPRQGGPASPDGIPAGAVPADRPRHIARWVVRSTLFARIVVVVCGLAIAAVRIGFACLLLAIAGGDPDATPFLFLSLIRFAAFALLSPLPGVSLVVFVIDALPGYWMAPDRNGELAWGLANPALAAFA